MLSERTRHSSTLVGVLLALILFLCTGWGGQNKSSDEIIKPFDDTTKWAIPYEADTEKIKRINGGIPAIKPQMTYHDAVAKLGAPDAVYDLRKPFFGLSPQEDGFLLRYRSRLSFRVLWYLSKHTTSPNLNDKWFALYIANDEKSLVARLANNIELPKVQ